MRFAGFLATILLLTALSWLLVGTFVHELIPGGWRTIGVAWARWATTRMTSTTGDQRSATSRLPWAARGEYKLALGVEP